MDGFTWHGSAASAHLTLVSLPLIHHLPVCSAVQAAAAALHLLNTGCQCCQRSEAPAPKVWWVWLVVLLRPERHHWTRSSKSPRESSHSQNKNLHKGVGGGQYVHVANSNIFVIMFEFYCLTKNVNDFNLEVWLLRALDNVHIHWHFVFHAALRYLRCFLMERTMLSKATVLV